MGIKPTRKGCKAWIILQILLSENCSVCVKDLAETAGTFCTSTTISQLRAKGWNIVNVRIDFKCPQTGKRETSSRYTLSTQLDSRQLELPFEA